MDRLVLLLQRFLERSVRRAARQLPSDATVREAAKMLSDLESAVFNSGLSQQLEGFREQFAKEYRLTGEDFTETTGKVAPLSALTQRDLAAVVDERLSLATAIAQRWVIDVRQGILDSVLLGKPVSVDRAIDEVGDKAFRQLTTEMNTAYMAYQRVVHLEKANKAGIDKFLYYGPDDKVTREFCHERVGKVYSLAEIESWDNGQGLPASIYCGGYNCRHHLRPISDALAAEIMGEQTPT